MVIGQPMTIEFGKKNFLSSFFYGACNNEYVCLNILQGTSQARSTMEQELEGVH
jgi:hypothetical protein